MKFTEAQSGRTFVIRLEDGDVLHEELERFAAEQGISSAHVTALGGVDVGSRLITGPAEGRTATIVPMETVLDQVYEATGTGTLFLDDTGKPMLHMHLACGRKERTITGCVRRGVIVWHVMEVVLVELHAPAAVRRMDPAIGFKILTL
ncbi:MAG: DNA-binding protein [Kiritimatiellaceae bacterium]|nr:DNA-binding protein [Kiritimatiellaceae bacterium]